jgi:hypothetical protein
LVKKWLSRLGIWRWAAFDLQRLRLTQTASSRTVSEKQVMNAKTELILSVLYPQTLTADHSDAQAKRIRN